MSFEFYLGVHRPDWMPVTSVPLFVSHRRLRERKGLPRAAGRWGLDSGGFSALSIEGKFVDTPSVYAKAAKRYRDEIGGLDMASIQDWMCEPAMLKKTGMTVRQHQELSVQSYVDLMSLDPATPWMPVLQGWEVGDYVEHVEMYARRGVDLWALPRVGVGSVCRRQSTEGVHDLLNALTNSGVRVHAFGFKTTGLPAVLPGLTSSDSMAWSLNARKNPPLPGHEHKNCANCLDYALAWRERLLGKLAVA